MTLRECLQVLGDHPEYYSLFFAGLVLSCCLGFFVPRVQRESPPWNYAYAVLVHLLCLPGVISLSLLAYLILFSRDHLFDLNLVVYGLPIVSLVTGLLLLRQQVTFQEIPGFQRLLGLIGLLSLSFMLVFMASRFWVGLIFGGSVFQLLILAGLVYLGLRWSVGRLFGQRNPRQSAYQFKGRR